MLDVELFGMDLGAHHLSNVAHHALATLLLFWFLYAATGALGPSFAVALLFAVHPLRVESVAWLSERKDTLSATLWMATLLCWLGYTRAKGSTGASTAARRSLGRWLLYGLALATYLLGLLAKPMLVSLPFVLVLLDVWPLRRLERDATPRSWRRWGSLALEKLPFLAAAAGVSWITLQAQAAIIKPLGGYPLADRVANGLVTPVIYLVRMVWPRDLAIFYPYDADRFGGALVAGCAALLVAITACALASRRRLPFLLVGWGWFLVTLVPVVGLVQVGLQARADRYTYLPSVGVLIAVLFGAWQWVGESRRRERAVAFALAAAVAVCGLLLAAATRAQLGTWRDPEALYRHAIAVTSGNDWAHYNLGQWLQRRGEAEAAIEQFAATVAIDPRNADAWRNLGLLRLELGRGADAAEALARAAALRPEDPLTLRDLAAAQVESGRPEEAAALLDRALDLGAQGDGQTLYLRALAALELGSEEAALSLLERAVAAAPQHAPAHNALGTLLARRGRLDLAEQHFAHAIEADPSYPEAQRNLERARALREGADER
jgi:Tfp pilus assembly protein PilF